MHTPDLALVAQAILSAKLQLSIQALLLEWAPRLLVSLAICRCHAQVVNATLSRPVLLQPKGESGNPRVENQLLLMIWHPGGLMLKAEFPQP